MVEYTDILVTGKRESVKEIIGQVFQQNGFSVEWSSEYEGKAKRGSSAMNVAFGAFAQSYEIGFQISPFPASDETVTVRVIKSKAGWTGGLIGKHKVTQQYEKIVEMLSDNFSSKGIYKGRTPK